MSRRLRAWILAIVALLLPLPAVLPAGPAAAAEPIHATGTTAYGQWVLDAPASFNGTVLLWSHGYTFTPVPGSNAPSAAVRDALLGQGYALDRLLVRRWRRRLGRPARGAGRHRGDRHREVPARRGERAAGLRLGRQPRRADHRDARGVQAGPAERRRPGLRRAGRDQQEPRPGPRRRGRGEAVLLPGDEADGLPQRGRGAGERRRRHEGDPQPGSPTRPSSPARQAACSG